MGEKRSGLQKRYLERNDEYISIHPAAMAALHRPPSTSSHQKNQIACSKPPSASSFIPPSIGLSTFTTSRPSTASLQYD